MRRAVAAVVVAATMFVLTACGQSSSASPSSLVDPNPDLVQPRAVHVDRHADRAEARRVVHTAQVLYTFWDTGDARWLRRAVTSDFRDRTLPAGRPQGPSGPVVASKGFRAAVPDLGLELQSVDVVGDRFTARMRFTGHFTGTYEGVRGRGQQVSFTAIDIQHADGPGGRITEDWHVEDMATFWSQIGFEPRPRS